GRHGLPHRDRPRAPAPGSTSLPRRLRGRGRPWGASSRGRVRPSRPVRIRRRSMNTSPSFEALRRANPRLRPGFDQAVEALGTTVELTPVDDVPPARPRRHVARVGIVGGALAVAATVAVFLTVASSGPAPGV